MSQTASSINYRLGSLYSVITAFLYATQEPFSFPAARHLNTLQFVALTQISLLVSIPLLLSRPTSRRDFVALFRKPINYGYLAVIFAIGMTGLLLYNFGLSNAHPIIISAILNLSPFWAALVALLISRVPFPISPATFFGCFAGAFLGETAIGRDVSQSTAAGTGAMIGRVIGAVGKLGIGAVMIVVIVVGAIL